MKKNIMLGLAFAFAVLGVSPVAFADHKGKEHGNKKPKITICHRTNAVNNPYRQITVNQNAADGVTGNQNKADHYDEHQGPLVTNKAQAQALKENKEKWGDIIPPIEGVHTGLNWTAEGQVIYRNGCKYATPEEPETPVTPETPGDNPLTPSSSVEEAQVEAPQSGVEAGEGDITSAIPAAVAFLGSIGTLAYGLVRFGKFGA